MACHFDHITIKSPLHKVNEDSYFIGHNLVIIADGMGGEACGDVASKIAVDTISCLLVEESMENSEINTRDAIFNAISKADSNISDYIEEHPEAAGMGTTVLVMWYNDGIMSIAWCGDSHCYSYHNGHLQSISKDHSYVQDLIDANMLSEDEALSHPDNNIITRFVGGGRTMCRPDFISHPLSDSEIIILCSDGLSGYCRKKEIENSIKSCRNIQSLPLRLNELATKHGSEDDITIVTFQQSLFGKSKLHFLNWLKHMTR